MSNDLSRIHKLITDLFKWPQTEKDWEKYRLSEEQVAFFKENGYLSHVKLLDPWQVDVLTKELEELTDPSHPGNELFYEFKSNESADPNTVLFHSLGHWRITSGFHDILWNPAFVMAASQLLGDRSVRFWHDQLFCKPAKHGGVVAWHQDYAYWTRSVPMQHLTCWVGLDDADTENGCVYYVPGSHRWGLLDKPELAGDMEGLMDYLTDAQKKEFRPVPIEMEKGYGTFHHPLMVHGSYENKSERSRRAFVLNVFADGTRSNTEHELLAGVPVFQPGEKLTGQFFPLLLERGANVQNS
ncbi:Ectoine hydroxylase-related dioxygenase, phytanoyl-CoA dioxygenase (PhyH) family [Cyclobacterium xiamenense]|uniref:Ectoine hydroxylase-related dioxygenase, phytanoyl-CoA dioxygenase (PhyH) family n=1 Tax=Cyclobacterium xiamenense TaxID=1297121 RepID=A0A1H6UKV4_9BACT|nr:phytanoyl-CoA dioxygenase family protein [Cyclobacterium xiamenense]SEI92941.1 Ectoine hydroxylase-related dioxygenase, phytanoyl-CoA dioxygenase (PhyH) family [Cyclobacterium xiamenense]